MDEFQNCRMSAPEFFSDLQKLWDQWRQKSKMLLILAGSVASAMHEITESPHAPLFGRDSGKMQLRPFSTAVIKQIFADFCPQSSADDLLTLYALTGGVPKYLEFLLESGCTTKEAMVSFALRPSSFFVTEANILFRTEFKTDYALYFEILEKIANGKTKRAEVISCFPNRNISGQLFRLEDYYGVCQDIFPVFVMQTFALHSISLSMPAHRSPRV